MPKKRKLFLFTITRKQTFIPQQNVTFANSEICWKQKLKILQVILAIRLTFKGYTAYAIGKINSLLNIKNKIKCYNAQ